MLDNYLADNDNPTPVRNCNLAPSSNSAILELSSVEETNRLVKLDTINIFNEKCKIIRMADTSSLT